MTYRIGVQSSPETKFRRFDSDLSLNEGAVISGYACLFGAADKGGDVV